MGKTGGGNKKNCFSHEGTLQNAQMYLFIKVKNKIKKTDTYSHYR